MILKSWKGIWMTSTLTLRTISALTFLCSVLLSSTSQGLPLLGDTFNIEITVPEAVELEKSLQTFIKLQQANNEQLRQIQDKNQYAKLLSALLRKQLKALGYYNFGLSLSGATNPRKILFLVQPGQRATIETIQVLQPPFVFESLQDIAIQSGFKIGAPLLAHEVLAAEQRLKDHINQNYCFVKPKLSKSITMNTLTKEAKVFFNLETEPGQNITEIRFIGNTTIDADFLRNVTKIETGCYKVAKIRQAQIFLLQTGLLTSAVPEVIPLEDLAVAIQFTVSERKHRTQSLRLGYSSDEGTRFNIGWEHRNWRGNSKKLNTQFQISQITTQLDAELRIPQFKHPDLDLLFQNEISKTKVDAFDSLGFESSAILEYAFSPGWLGSVGVATEYSKVETQLQSDIFRLVSFPLSIQNDTSNDLLDPTKGAIWTFSVQPYIDLVNPDVQFTQIASSLRTYYSPPLRLNSAQQKPITIALRFALGSIAGEQLQAIPADQRFYVGGGGSVRGFEFQSILPRNSAQIAGGLSYMEAASELRFRMNKNWGSSIFVDGGTSFTQKSPDLGARLSLGGGFGVRYMTSFAPIRLDIAWPLSSTTEFETKAQLYVGLKQAF